VTSPVAVGTCPVGAATLASDLSCQLACVGTHTLASGGNYTCQASSWVGVAAVCQANCAVAPPAGTVANTCGATLPGSGGSCTLGLVSGYSLAPDGSSLSLTCQDGVLSPYPNTTGQREEGRQAHGGGQDSVDWTSRAEMPP
jgi:hypothetical protein